MLRNAVLTYLLLAWTTGSPGEESGGPPSSAQRPFVAVCSDTIRVLAVSDSDGIVQLPLQLGGDGGHVGWGSTGPVVSPNGRWVAFAKSRDLFLFEVATNKESRITVFNGDSQAPECDLFVTGWSFDSRRLIYFIKDYEVFFESYGRRDCPANGFFIYELETHAVDSLAVSGEFACWLPDGRVVLSRWSGFSLFESGRLNELPSTPFIRYPGQVQCCPDGRRLVTQHSPTEHESQIVEVDLGNGTLRAVTPVGPPTQWQWPTYSPSGNHIAVLEESGWDRRVVHDTNTGDKKPMDTHHRSIWVDGAKVIDHTNISRYSWLDDITLAFSADDSAFVVNIGGQVLARRGF